MNLMDAFAILPEPRNGPAQHNERPGSSLGKAGVKSCIDAFRHVVFRQWHDFSELNLSVGFIACSVPCDYLTARCYPLSIARTVLEELRGQANEHHLT